MPDTDEVLEAVRNDELVGWCIKCGADHYLVEPDARKYKCDECGAMEVYGASEILLCGMHTTGKKGTE